VDALVMRRRVVITGMGVITPTGHSVSELFEAQVAGRSGAGPIASFDASTFPTKIAAEVKDFSLGKFLREPPNWDDTGVNCRFAAAAAQQALGAAGVLDDSRVDRERFGIYLGCGEGIQDSAHLTALLAEAYRPERRTVDVTAFTAGGLQRLHPGREFEQELHTTPGRLAEYFHLEGPN